MNAEAAPVAADLWTKPIGRYDASMVKKLSGLYHCLLGQWGHPTLSRFYRAMHISAKRGLVRLSVA